MRQDRLERAFARALAGERLIIESRKQIKEVRRWIERFENKKSDRQGEVTFDNFIESCNREVSKLPYLEELP